MFPNKFCKFLFKNTYSVEHLLRATSEVSSSKNFRQKLMLFFLFIHLVDTSSSEEELKVSVRKSDKVFNDIIKITIGSWKFWFSILSYWGSFHQQISFHQKIGWWEAGGSSVFFHPKIQLLFILEQFNKFEERRKKKIEVIVQNYHLLFKKGRESFEVFSHEHF